MTQSNRFLPLALAAVLVFSVAGGASLAGTVAAAEDPSLRIVEVDAEGEYVVVENNGDETVDLDFAEIDFEANGEADEVATFPVGTAIEPGKRLVVATGAEPVADADVEFDFDSGVVESDDQIVIQTPAGDPLTQNGEEPTLDEPSEGDLTGPDGEDTPAETPEDEPTDDTPTDTPEDEPTDDTPTDTPEDAPTDDTPEDAPTDDTPTDTPEDEPTDGTTSPPSDSDESNDQPTVDPDEC
jgi:hypothetical protein